ncbi:MAG TPA: Gldg family protein [Acidobacteriota bacterium]|mgnify:FL=1|nr:Gldg family protein [Acidobacteriota bacterium]|tara:strand:+ start:8653 stop:10341 length:1689 start_codon:yes stop_codon:yes gene_type:complete
MTSYRSFGMFGLIFLLFGILAGMASGIWNSMYVLAHLISGTSMLALYLFTHVENLRESVTGRRTQYATNTFVYTGLTLAVIVLLNFMGARNEYRYDASEQSIFSIAPQTASLLEGLANDIHVLAFFRENEGQAAENLLDTYTAGSDRFSYEMVDPDQRPEMAQQYEVTQYGTLVIVYGDNSTRVNDLSEEVLTNALVRITGAETKRIYFVTGHGEPDITARETPDGLGQLAASLENEGAEVVPLLLATVPDVPADASLLIVASPQRPFLENEIESLGRYLDRGGRAWILLEPQRSDELVPLLAERGIIVGDNVVIDVVVQLLAGPSAGVEPVVSDYGFHPITEQFNQNTVFRIVRSIEPAGELPDGITASTLASTSSNSWAESNVDLVFETGEVDPEGDVEGPVSIAVAATLGPSILNWTTPAIETTPSTNDGPGVAETQDASEGADIASNINESKSQEITGDGSGATPPTDLEGRIVVVGDADWLNNSRLTVMYNEDLALNMVGWLTGGNESTITIRPRARRSSRITLTDTQGWGVFYATVLLLPELVLLSGLMIWWRRRR